MKNRTPACLTVLLLILVGFASNVDAHVRLKSSEPVDGSTVAAPPEHVTLVFSESARVTALTVQSASDTTATKVAVTPGEPTIVHTIPLPKLAQGDYVVTWRALSGDTHVMSGTLRFSVRPAPATQQ